MKKIISDKILRIIKLRKELEKKLEVKITNRGKEIFIVGTPENEYIAEKVIEALNFGFPFSNAIQIKEEDFLFEKLNIKDYSKQKNLERVRGRLIGKGGKTLKILSDLTRCFLELKDNEIGIIGNPEHIQNVQEACISIIQGSKQSNVYAHLEKHQPKPVEDLGLKK